MCQGLTRAEALPMRALAGVHSQYPGTQVPVPGPACGCGGRMTRCQVIAYLVGRYGMGTRSSRSTNRYDLIFIATFFLLTDTLNSCPFLEGIYYKGSAQAKDIFLCYCPTVWDPLLCFDTHLRCSPRLRCAGSMKVVLPGKPEARLQALATGFWDSRRIIVSRLDLATVHWSGGTTDSSHRRT